MSFLVVIASAGHSGSTLLDLLLGNHPQVCSAGEMNRLTLNSADRVCACGATIDDCAYWTSVRAAITKQRSRGSLIRWDECHTDIYPETPVLRLDKSLSNQLIDGEYVPAAVRSQLVDGGLQVGDQATFSRGGVRDRKWRVVDPAAHVSYVLRDRPDCLEVYDASVKWKNPFRVVPEPIELALALGSTSVLNILRGCSSNAARRVEIADNSWSVADAMSAVSGARFVVDSSKSPARLKLLYMRRPEHVRIIQLVRDGRAVSASAMRRQDLSASTAARRWKRDNRNLAVMLRSVPQHVKLSVRYESVCENPGAELRRVCDFLGLQFEPEMLNLWTRPVHNIPGNPMLFNRAQQSIRKDERWRRELSTTDIEAFDRIAGRFNRSLGYV